MTTITLSSGKTANLNAAENEYLTAALAARQADEAVYFCDDARLCNDCTPNRFIGTQAQIAALLHDWAYGTWRRDERGNYGSLEEIKANLLAEFLAVSQIVEAIDGKTLQYLLI